MSGVYYCSPFNSTHFTTCCNVAITSSEQKCPRCRKDVYPFFEGMTDKERDEATGGYLHHKTEMARHDSCRRGRRY